MVPGPGPWGYVGLRVRELAPPNASLALRLELGLGLALLPLALGLALALPPEFWGEEGLRALMIPPIPGAGPIPCKWTPVPVPVPLVLVVVRLGKLAWPWLLPADRGLGDEAVAGGVALCWAWGCDARLTKPSCMCCTCGGDVERAAAAANWGVLVNWDWDGGRESERDVCMGWTCEGS